MSDFSKYLVENPKTGVVAFMGDTLEVFIPKAFERHGCLEIANDVFTLGLFDMRLNGGKWLGYTLPAHIHMSPSKIENETLGDMDCAKLTFNKGDLFMLSTTIVKNGYLAYVCFYEYIFMGMRHRFMSYDMISKLFITVQEVCGINLNTDQVVFELISSHLHRSPESLKLFYRLTDMAKAPVALPMKDVAHTTMSTNSKLVGPYLSDSINASLVNAADQKSKNENLLRS